MLRIKNCDWVTHLLRAANMMNTVELTPSDSQYRSVAIRRFFLLLYQYPRLTPITQYIYIYIYIAYHTKLSVIKHMWKTTIYKNDLQFLVQFMFTV